MVDAVDEFVRLARASGGDENRMRFELRSRAHASLHDHGCRLSAERIDAILGKDFELNAAGLASWLTREAG
jgi:hypothetical protein